MKNKKSLLSLGLLALVLVLGVGYAVVSSVDLTIGGSASVKSADLAVDICSATDVSTVTTDGATVNHTLTEHSREASFTITEMTLNEEVTITYTVTNHETDVTATLSENAEGALEWSNKDNFDVSYSFENNKTELAPGDSTNVVVKVKLKKTPVVEANGTTNVSFKLDATPVNNATPSN